MTRVVLAASLVLLPSCAFDEEATGVGATLSSTTTSGGSSGAMTTGTTALPTTSSSDGSSGQPTTSTSTSTSTTTTTSTTGSTGPGSSSDASSGSTTEPPPPGCDDGQHNQDETDVDCGGSCGPCLDGQLCALPGDCQSGLCEGGVCAPAECLGDEDCAAMAGPCTAASCDVETKQCVTAPANEGMSCDDGDPCSQSSQCVAGVCTGAEPLDCSQLDSFCGLGFCEPQTGQCAVKSKDGMDGQPCDDGFECTPQDVCAAGTCGDGTPGYLLFESFSGAAPGWDLGPTWQIAAAKPSKNTAFGMDPATDHSPTAEDRLAGVIVGGVSEGGAQAKTCLTSPPVDTAASGKSAYVTFWRHLHTEYFPFALNQIEVFDGIDWIELEAGYNNPGINDANWQQVFFDVADFSNEALQLRICYTRSADADSFPGWSVDDVTIGPHVCTPE
jgi:hypothetical protein